MEIQEMGEVLSRLDERTKYIKEKLDDHVKSNPCETCELQPRMATVETNLKWIKRTAVGLFGIATLVSGWFGLK